MLLPSLSASHSGSESRDAIYTGLQDFAFAFQCFMLEYWDREDTGRWPKNPSLSPNVSDDPVLMQDLLTELGKMEPNQEGNPWVSSSSTSSSQLVIGLCGSVGVCEILGWQQSYASVSLDLSYPLSTSGPINDVYRIPFHVLLETRWTFLF